MELNTIIITTVLLCLVWIWQMCWRSMALPIAYLLGLRLLLCIVPVLNFPTLSWSLYLMAKESTTMRKWLETIICLVGMRAWTHDNTQIWNRIECKLIYKTIIFERKVSVLCKYMLLFYLWYRVCVLMLNLTIEYINSNDVHYLIDNKL